MKFRKHFDYDVEKASDEATIPAEMQGKSLTVQSMAEDADLNVMMARFGVTGKMPENPRIPSYGDFSDIRDYRSALEAVTNASDAFMALPATLRAQFDNDPQRLLEFVSDDRNHEAARQLGLLKENINVGSSPGVSPEGGDSQPAGAGASAG